ncbi:hypothetical protein BB560_003660, partial [Smittium megazygosporum]
MKKKIKTKFPVARIKRIMQMDEDVGKMSQTTPVLISKALEIFMQNIIDDVAKKARASNMKRLMPFHLKRCVDEIPCYDFLKDIVAKVQIDQPKSSSAPSQTSLKHHPSDSQHSQHPQPEPQSKLSHPINPATPESKNPSTSLLKSKDTSSRQLTSSASSLAPRKSAHLNPHTSNPIPIKSEPITHQIPTSIPNPINPISPKPTVSQSNTNASIPSAHRNIPHPSPPPPSSSQNFDFKPLTLPNENIPSNYSQPHQTTILPPIGQIHQLAQSSLKNQNSPYESSTVFINQKLPPPILHNPANNLPSRSDPNLSQPSSHYPHNLSSQTPYYDQNVIPNSSSNQENSFYNRSSNPRQYQYLDNQRFERSQLQSHMPPSHPQDYPDSHNLPTRPQTLDINQNYNDNTNFSNIDDYRYNDDYPFGRRHSNSGVSVEQYHYHHKSL